MTGSNSTMTTSEDDEILSRVSSIGGSNDDDNDLDRTSGNRPSATNGHRRKNNKRFGRHHLNDDTAAAAGAAADHSNDDDHHRQGDTDPEARCLKISRGVVLFLLFVTACTAGTLTYFFVSSSQQDDFETHISSHSFEIIEATQYKSKSIFGMVQTLALTISAYAKTSSTDDTTWPFITFPNFEEVVSSYRNVTGARLIATAPMVSSLDGNKEAWEGYSMTNQDWITDSYHTIGVDDINPLRIPEVIYNLVDGRATEAKGGPFFLPLWQMSEPPKNTAVVNFNLNSNAEFANAYSIATAHHEGVLTDTVNMGTMLFGEPSSDDEAESIIVQPIYRDLTAPTLDPVGVVMAVITWETFLSDLVREDNRGMVCVLRSSCGGTYTYTIQGSQVVLEGEGDYHDATYDEYVHVAEVAPFLKIPDMASVPTDYCEYVLHIYPSVGMEDNFKNARPAIFTALMVALFVAASIGFLVYDYMVQKRQREAMDTAAKSNAIVSSLFPAEIRDRLFHGDGDDVVGSTDGTVLRKEKQMDSQLLADLPEAQRFRLKNYLTEEEGGGGGIPFLEKQESRLGHSSHSEIQETKPIADLFPNTTVLFADIAGFTAWSSVREPSQVFTLLETVYKAFDKTAKRRKVFKVETVGDCYVAVTGLPEANKDHAIIMCRFARECVTQFNELVRQLEVLLGPDTGDLGIRVGLHSGPVTAGVLRGDKSRFQLFGDTVNTAARIESTGQRNKIHLSHETAELLHSGGKSNWLRKRAETVVAKGKGEMQTYWLLTEEELASGVQENDIPKGAAPLPIVKAMQPRIAKAALDVLDPESTLPPRIKRLVDWNVDVLKRLLKQIVAKRNRSTAEKYHLNHPLMMKNEVNIGCDTYVLDEVTEIIRLPGYTYDVKTRENPNKIELSSDVEDQLRLYVASIAAMHRDNPFHNFEHASHVMMSVSKLLSRIVAPDEVLHGGDTQDKLHLSLHDHTYGITSDPLTQFSVVLAALIHDVDHSGVSNFQLIKENAKIATVFKNKSVAEQNSIVLAWDRLMESRFTALRACIYSDPDELKRFRQLVVNTVMATDIFDKELQTLRKNRWDKAFRHISQAVDSSPEDDVNRKATIVIEHLIQASDVAHTMQHWHIYQKWNERLYAEMAVAHQNGRMAKNPADGWYRGELGFFDNYVIPLAKKLKECGVFGVSSDEYLNYALENRREWATKGEEVVSKMVEKYTKNNHGEDAASKDNDPTKHSQKKN